MVLERETNQARSRTIHNHGRLRIVCMTARLDVTPKTTEQNRIVRTGKSEAEVTNNKQTALEVLYEATKLTTDRHETSRGLFATAELLVDWGEHIICWFDLETRSKVIKDGVLGQNTYDFLLVFEQSSSEEPGNINLRTPQ